MFVLSSHIIVCDYRGGKYVLIGSFVGKIKSRLVYDFIQSCHSLLSKV